MGAATNDIVRYPFHSCLQLHRKGYPISTGRPRYESLKLAYAVSCSSQIFNKNTVQCMTNHAQVFPPFFSIVNIYSVLFIYNVGNVPSKTVGFSVVQPNQYSNQSSWCALDISRRGQHGLTPEGSKITSRNRYCLLFNLITRELFNVELHWYLNGPRFHFLLSEIVYVISVFVFRVLHWL